MCQARARCNEAAATANAFAGGREGIRLRKRKLDSVIFLVKAPICLKLQLQQPTPVDAVVIKTSFGLLHSEVVFFFDEFHDARSYYLVPAL